jgi:hypothetical protein
LPTLAGSPAQLPPTHHWQNVIAVLMDQRIGTVAQARAWVASTEVVEIR